MCSRCGWTSRTALLCHLTDTHSAEQHLGAINYIGGGATGFTAQKPQSDGQPK
jgi:hypothetical protein